MTKSQEYFQDMMENHKEIFNKFQTIHDKYLSDPKKFQAEFNEKGEEIMTIIRRYETLLCGKAESSRFGKFSSKTAETFWKYIKAKFPQIEAVGLIQ